MQSTIPRGFGSTSSLIAIIVIVALILLALYYGGGFGGTTPTSDEEAQALLEQGDSDELADIEADAEVTDFTGVDAAMANVISAFEEEQ